MTAATIEKRAVTGEVLPAQSSRPVQAVLMTSAFAADGLSLDPLGCDLRRFRRSPVLLVAHDVRKLPVGRVGNVRIETIWVDPDGEITVGGVALNGGRKLTGLVGTLEFDPASAAAREAEASVRGGYTRGVSIGFDVKKNARDFRTGKVSSWVLNEVSLVPVALDDHARIYQRSWQPSPPSPSPTTVRRPIVEETPMRRALWASRNLPVEPDPAPAMSSEMALALVAARSFGPYASSPGPGADVDAARTYLRSHRVSADDWPEPLPAEPRRWNWDPFAIPLAAPATRPERRNAAEDRELLARAGALAQRVRRERDAARWRRRKAGMEIEEYCEVVESRARINGLIRAHNPKPALADDFPTYIVSGFGPGGGM